MGRVLHGIHIVHHGLIHQIRAGLAGRQLSATGADTVQRGQVKAVGGQRLLNGGLAEVHLLHDPVERGQLLAGVALRLIKELPLPLEHGDLRGGRAGVDDQYPFAHSVYAPGGPLRLLLSVSKNLVKPARLCYHFFKVSPAGRRRDCPLGRMWASAPTHGFSVVVSVGGDALIAPHTAPAVSFRASDRRHWRGNPFPFYASGGLFSFNSERKEEKNAAKNYVFGFPCAASHGTYLAKISHANAVPCKLPLNVALSLLL